MRGLWSVALLGMVLGCGGLWPLGGSETGLAKALREAGRHPAAGAPAEPLLALRCVTTPPSAEAACVSAAQARAEGLADAMAVPITVTSPAGGEVHVAMPALDDGVQQRVRELLTAVGGLCIQRAAGEAALRALVAQAVAAGVRPEVILPDAAHTTLSVAGIAPEEWALLRSLAEAGGQALGAEVGATEARVHLLDAGCALDGAHLADVAVITGPEGMGGEPSLRLQFTTAGAAAFHAFTAENVDQVVAMMLGEGGQVLMAPVVKEPIAGGTALLTQGQGGGGGEEAALLRLLDLYVLREQLRHPYPAGSRLEAVAELR